MFRGPSGFRSAPFWGGAGEHVDRFFVRHAALGTHYLKFLPTTDQHGRPRLPRVLYRWRDNGIEIPWGTVRPWLVRPAVSRRQGTLRPVHWRTIAVRSVLELRMGGAVYSLC